MMIKKSILFIIMIMMISCSKKQTDNSITEFENLLGERKTASLNLLVADFEKNLRKIYPDLPTEKAYQQYLKDIISTSTIDWNKFKFQSEETKTDFKENGLLDDVYIKDTAQGLQINQTGNYMKALYKIKDFDSLIKKYWAKRETVGMMQNELVVHGILNANPNFNDYFHKRIVVIEFSF